MHARTALAALLAIFMVVPVAAYDPAKAPRYPSMDLYRPNADQLTINGPGGIACANPGGCSISGMGVPGRLGTSLRTLADKLRALPVTPLDRGAQCGGLVNAASAFSDLDAAGIPITLPDTCVLRVGSNLTLNGPLTGAAGGVLKIDGGATLTLAGGYTGPLTPAFDTTGGGRVAFSPATQPAVYFEWWGAVAGDWLPAFNSSASSGALKILPQGRDYPISATWKVNVPGLAIEGPASRNKVPGQSPRILLVSATADVMQMGPDSLPAGGINAFTPGMSLRNVHLTRNAAPTYPANGDIYNGATGLRAQYLLDSVIEHVTGAENNIDFRLHGLVYTRVDDNYSFRSTNSASPSTDYHIGYYLAGDLEGFAAGGNASVYMTRNNTTVGGGITLTTNTGLLARYGLSDTIVRGFEAAGVKIGWHLQGVVGTSYTGDTYKAASADVHIDNPIIDAFTSYGGVIENIPSGYAAIRVTGGYSAHAGGAAADSAGLFVNNVNGPLSIAQHQIICWANRAGGGTGLGLSVQNSSSIHSSGNMLIGCARPEVLSNVKTSTFDDVIANPVGALPSQSHVYLAGTQRTSVRPIISGVASGQGFAITVDGASSYNEVNPTAVDPAVAGGKVGYNGSAVTATGTFGTGNVLTGVPN